MALNCGISLLWLSNPLKKMAPHHKLLISSDASTMYVEETGILL